MGETSIAVSCDTQPGLSVSSNGSTWVKRGDARPEAPGWNALSVSSNGSTWVKLIRHRPHLLLQVPFSILERIDVGETSIQCDCVQSSGSVLSVSSNGSTWVKRGTERHLGRQQPSFSILERIDVGETNERTGWGVRIRGLSVSSNGSTWVKHSTTTARSPTAPPFQYPRTDRRG